jgi:tRNA nucleotidyltransferase/poly(A) polymerase
MDVPHLFKTIAAVSKKTSMDAFVVGGYVRDELLGREQKKDIDVVVAGSGIQFAEAFDAEMKEAGRLVLFPDFDTARYVFTEEHEGERKTVLLEIEFAGARKERYRSESRKPAVVSATIKEDLARRDFTVNTLARKIGAGGRLLKIVDPFDGQKDLKKKLLRTPLDPDETFSDDPLRMLRAARFAVQLGFDIEEKTYEAMKRNAERLKIISMERIQEELFKLLAAPKPSIGLWIITNAGLMDMFLPEVKELGGVEEVFGYAHKDNLSHTFAVVDNIAEQGGDALLRFAGLLHDIAKPNTKKFVRGRGWTFDMHEHLGRKMVRIIGSRLRMKKSDIEYVAKLVRWHLQPIALMDKGVTDTPVRRLIVNLKDDLGNLLILCRADITTGNQKKKVRRLKNYDYLEKRISEVVEKDKLRAFQSPFRGEEIIKATGLKPGPTIGKIKTAIEEAILEGEIPNEYDAAKVYFEKIKDHYIKEAGDWERV